jgi:ABC-type branched-subunit amino acid transport system substrate-binding protein
MLQPATATTCAHKTIAKHPIAMFGCELAWSASGLQVYAKAKTPSVNCLNTDEDYSNPWSFGIVGGSLGQNRAMARWLCSRADVTKVVSLLPDNPVYHSTIYPKGPADVLKGCGKQSAVVYYPLTAVDVTQYVEKVASEKPDFVNVSAIGPQALNFFKVFQQQHIPPDKVAMPDIVFTKELTDQGGASMNGAYMAGQFTPWGVKDDPDVADYLKKAAGAAVDPRNPTVEWGYAYIMCFYTAAKEIGFDKFDGETLAAWLRTADGVKLPLSRAIKNPGPEGYAQVKQPYERIAQWTGGEFKIPPAGDDKDGWVYGY